MPSAEAGRACSMRTNAMTLRQTAGHPSRILPKPWSVRAALRRSTRRSIYWVDGTGVRWPACKSTRRCTVSLCPACQDSNKVCLTASLQRGFGQLLDAWQGFAVPRDLRQAVLLTHGFGCHPRFVVAHRSGHAQGFERSAFTQTRLLAQARQNIFKVSRRALKQPLYGMILCPENRQCLSKVSRQRQPALLARVTRVAVTHPQRWCAGF